MHWLTVEDLGHQVVDDMTVVACERLDERRCITTPGKRYGGKVEARGPAFGASVQQLDIVVSQIQPEYVVKQMVCLNGVET